MASDMVLYWGSGSPPCWSAMITLEEKGLQGYKSHLISFSNKEHKAENVLKINPRGQVPTFHHGDVIVNESLAICDYLQAVFPSQGTCLLPKEPAQLAQVLQRKYEVTNLRKKVIEDYAFYKIQTKPEDQDQELLKTKREAVQTEVKMWESYLEKAGTGSHLASKDFSMADVFFFPILAIVVRFGFPLARYPHLQAYYNMVKDRASVQASWPPHWKDSEGGDKLADC